MSDPRNGRRSKTLLWMTLGAIGVVFGDIGTSPMYAIKESLHTPALPMAAGSVLGIISLVFWSLILVVTVKYVMCITLADNEGEGGMLALVSLLKSRSRKVGRAAMWLAVALGTWATGLFFADALLTPALSVLAATEGVALQFPGHHFAVVGVASVVVFCLFGVQRFGTTHISRLCMPVMLVWFVLLAALGVLQIVQTPHILAAMSPRYAIELMQLLSWGQRLSLLGSVLLAVTGAEAIYADMGHFSRKAIAGAWYYCALWALALNYFGQGAWLLRTNALLSSDRDISPFFQMIPSSLVLPMGILSLAATVIASQAVISGVFSMASQAIQLNFLPRLEVVHTSLVTRGQIYVPRINLLLGVGCLLLVFGFGSSDALASAYGFAIATTMLITTIVFMLVVAHSLQWSKVKLVLFAAFALPLDAMFFAATLDKLHESHYLTLIIALFVVSLLVIWRIGRRYLMERAQRLDMPVGLFAEMIAERTDVKREHKPDVFFQHLPFSAQMEVTPNVLLRHIQQTSTLGQPTVIVEFITGPVPRVPENARITMRAYSNRIYSLHAYFGFAEQVSIKPIFEFGIQQGWWTNVDEIRYHLGREDLRPYAPKGMPRWMRWPFIWLHRQDQSLAHTLEIPAAQFSEVAIVINI